MRRKARRLDGDRKGLYRVEIGSEVRWTIYVWFVMVSVDFKVFIRGFSTPKMNYLFFMRFFNKIFASPRFASTHSNKITIKIIYRKALIKE